MMTTPLTPDELHDRIRPANFDPADVEVIGFIDTRPPALNADALFGLPADMYDIVYAEFREHLAAWKTRNVELLGREFPGSRCEHCGAAIRWAAIVRYIPTGQGFITGETCADERMSLGSRVAHLARLERMAVQHRAEMARRAEARAYFYREHPAEAAYLFDPDRPHDMFLDDLADKLTRYGELSDKQVAAITRNIERAAERAAVRAAEAETAGPFREGRIDMVGEIVSTKVQDGDYGATFKMLVRLDDGNKVWGTVPRVLEDATVWTRYYDENGSYVEIPPAVPNGLPGTRVRFTATVTRSHNDEHFGFFKRPTNTTIIDTGEESR